MEAIRLAHGTAVPMVPAPSPDASAAMRRYASGDETAFAEVYDALAPRLFPFLMRLARERALAEDLLQQTFFQMHNARHHYILDSDVVPWSFAIARRVFLDSARRSRRVARLIDQAEELPDHAGPASEDGARWAEAHELARAMNDRLQTMPKNQREAFALVKQDGLSVAEAAQILGVTVATVKLRAHRAYEQLRAAVKSFGGADEGGDA